MKKIFDYRLKYIAHLYLILLALFLAYPLGDKFLGFQTGTELVKLLKMFGFFSVILYLADNIFEYLFEV